MNAYFLVVVASFTWLMLASANAQTYYLGVLAPQGETVAPERWKPWFNQLNEQLQEDTVVLVPLALENWQQEIEAQQFALVLGPQVQLIKMNTTHWRWLATLQADTETAQLDRPDDNRGKKFHKKSFNKSADKQISTTVNLANEFNKLSQDRQLKEPSAMEAVASALWVKVHRLWMAVIVSIILISTVNYAWMSWLAWRRRQKIILQNQLIRDYDQQLRQSERFAVIGEMSGSIAHEINQPLATIQNYAQGLLIRSQSNQMSRRVQESTDVDKNSVNRLHVLEKQATESALQQNAEQQGATQIMLHCQAKDYNGKSYIVLHITDDAGGFDEAQLLDHKPLEGNQQLVEGQSQQRLTNKYATKSTKENGLGLGLMICQRLCKPLGGMMQLGNIEVQQELNTIQALGGYQQRLKRSLNGKVRLIKTENTHPLTNRVGAQVSFYLPLHLADDVER